jgi:hypothetical protein
MEFHPFRFDVKKLRPLLQRDLYTDPNVMLRELAQNAHDAIMRRAQLDPHFRPERDGHVLFQVDKMAGTLVVSDNGAGMDRQDLLDIFRWYGRSDKSAGEVGTFGLGAKSIFATADSFTIHTKSLKTGKTCQAYVKLEGLAFQPTPPTRSEPGTTIAVPLGNIKIRTNLNDDNFYDADDEDDDRSGHNQLRLAALVDFCRCVKVPIFVQRRQRKQLISQKHPWSGQREPSERFTHPIRGDGFELYLSTGDVTFKVYVNGFFVCEYDDNDRRNRPEHDHVAVNILKKGLVDVTISRDGIIKDMKYDALLHNINKTIIEHASTFNFWGRTSVCASGGQVFVKWLKQSRLFKKLAINVQQAVSLLNGDVTACPMQNSAYDHTVTLLEFLARKERKYYQFGMMRQEQADIMAKANNISILTHPRELGKQGLLEYLARVGVKKLDGVKKTRAEYVLCDDNESRHFNTLEQLKNDRHASSETYRKDHPLFIFPPATTVLQLRKLSRRLHIMAVKLKDGEQLNLCSVHDLRNISHSRVTLHGVDIDLDKVNVSRTSIAPPEFYKFAQQATKNAVIFTADLASVCLLAVRGATFADSEDLHGVLKVSLPPSVKDNFTPWQMESEEHCSTLAKIASTVDWNHPYFPWMFRYAVAREWQADEVLEGLGGYQVIALRGED